MRPPNFGAERFSGIVSFRSNCRPAAVTITKPFAVSAAGSNYDKKYIENGNTTLIQLHHFVFNLGRSGPISALIATNRTGFVPGEMIGFSAEVFLEEKKTSL